MISGITIGLVSAILQSSAYIFSRRFIVKHNSPLKLMVYGNLNLGLLSLITLAILTPFVSFSFSYLMVVWMIIFAFCGCLGGFTFFRALGDIEASRLSSLMGLKLAVLTPLNILFVHTLPDTWQILSIVLSIIAAVGMNFSGGPLPLRGLLFLSVTLLCYSLTDIAAAEMTKLADSGIFSAVYATCLAFCAAALIPAAMLCKLKFEKSCFNTAVPYAVFWFVAMIMLFMTFEMIGVLYGTIIQATRGLFSVILGWILLQIGFERLEPQASTGAWIRRLIMALLMILAIAIYNAGKA